MLFVTYFLSPSKQITNQRELGEHGFFYLMAQNDEVSHNRKMTVGGDRSHSDEFWCLLRPRHFPQTWGYQPVRWDFSPQLTLCRKSQTCLQLCFHGDSKSQQVDN